jgi:TRAP-type C4-dicarboxylate transport system permease small subunit
MIVLAGLGIILMLVLVVTDVIGRSVLNVAIPGIDTVVASYLMVATIFLPLGLLQLLDENIAVDILRDWVPDAIKEYVTGTWNVPIWPARILMPIGLFVAAIAAVAKLTHAIGALFSGSKPDSHDFSEPV